METFNGGLDMKKLLTGLLLSVCGVSHAITYQAVRASTANVLTPSLQTGTMNLSSGTVTNLNTTTLKGASGTFTGTVTAGDFSGPGTSLTGVIINQETLQSGATFYVSSGTVNAMNIGTSWNAASGASLNAGSNRITKVSTPTLSTDAATKGYVDSIANGSTNYIQATAALQSGATFYVSSGTVNNFTVQQATVTTSLSLNSTKLLNVSSGVVATDGVAFSQVKVLQVVFASVNGSSSTTTTSWAKTGLAATITPSSDSSKIAMYFSGTAYNTTTAKNCFFTFLRGSTNIANTNGIAASGVTATVTADMPVSAVWVDSPATTSATTYTVGFETDSGGTCRLGLDSNSTASLILMEINGI
jgi:hypothetical protein